MQSYTTDRDGGRTASRSRGAPRPIYVECLTPGSWAEFDIKVDDKILGDFKERNGDLPFDDGSSLLDLVRRFYSQVWGFDRRYYGLEGGESATPETPGSGPPSFEEWCRNEKGIDLSTLSRRGKERRKLEA